MRYFNIAAIYADGLPNTAVIFMDAPSNIAAIDSDVLSNATANLDTLSKLLELTVNQDISIIYPSR